jgi:hypothetical protein
LAVGGLQDSAKCFFITARQTGLGLRLSATHRALLSSYLLNLWRGPEAVRKLMVADIRLWIELGAPERAADAFLVLRQFLSDFPEAKIGIAFTNPHQPFISHFGERRPRRSQFGLRGRASMTPVRSGPTKT